MKFFNIFLLFFLTQNIYTFNVKVLLSRVSKESLKKNPLQFKSTTGFLVGESGKKLHPIKEKKITVLLKEDGLFVNKQKVCNQVSLRPQLSQKQKKDITALVTHWTHDIKKSAEESFVSLHELCDKLVVKKKHAKALENQKLESFFLHWLQKFCEYITCGKHNHETLQNSLQNIVKKMVYARAKNLFIQRVAEVDLSRSEYYKLGNRKEYRYQFFYKIALRCLREIAQEFLLSLSDQDIRRIISEAVHGIEYDSGVYWGDIYIVEHKDYYLIINNLDIDDYLVSVLDAEGWPGWPLEVNKVLVIASRSYLVSKILEAVRRKRLFHIKNTISHQTYKGYRKVHKNVLRAAEETRDIIMVYNGKPVEAMFDSCCGGVIPAKISDFSFEKVPYLARTKVCNYCKPCWIYRWKSSFSQKQLLEKFQKLFPDMRRITEFRVVKRDDAKIVKKVLLFDGKTKYFVTGKKIYSLFPEVKSFCFNIKKKGKQYLIHGRGYGHHIGLCQWGARKMVDAHWNYKSILKFYYPGIEFMQLSYL